MGNFSNLNNENRASAIDNELRSENKDYNAEMSYSDNSDCTECNETADNLYLENNVSVSKECITPNQIDEADKKCYNGTDNTSVEETSLLHLSDGKKSETSKRRSRLDVTAEIICRLFNPLLIPIYLSIMILFGRMVPIVMPARMNLYVLFIVVLNALLIPFFFAFILKSTHIIKDFSFTSLRERYFMMFVVALGYGVCAWHFSGIELLFLFRRIMLAFMCCVFLACILNSLRQADFHMIAMGALTGMVWILIYAGYYKMLIPFCVILFCSGLVASSLLYLQDVKWTKILLNYLVSAVMTGFVVILS